MSVYASQPDLAKRIGKLLRLPRSEREATELVEAYAAGETIRQLAGRYGIDRSRVTKLIKTAGVQVRDHEQVNIDLERVAELKKQGLNLYQIAEIIGVGRTTIFKARQRARS